MTGNIIIFLISMFMVVKGATMATKHAALIAESFRLSKYVVGFIIVAVISILPETLVAVNSAIEGSPSFGLGTLFGSNVADLTLLFAILVFIAGRDLKVESKILKNNFVYPFLLLIPLILGLDGYYSRPEGVALILIGAIFYISALKGSIDDSMPFHNGIGRLKHILILLFSMGLLLVGAHYTVVSATSVANLLGLNPILIGMLIVGLGTTLPEMFFSIKCVKKKDDSLAVGDLLGTVLADATIVVGILALLSPFSFSVRIIYITGAFMAAASFLLFYFMNTDRRITKIEALFLLLFWIAFVVFQSIFIR